MTLLTIVPIRNRVMALCELITLPSPMGKGKAYRTLEECSFSAKSLPAFVVKAGERGSEYQYSDSHVSYLSTREITIGLYLAHMKDESYKTDIDMMDLSEIVAATVVHFFTARPTLSLDDDNGLVEQARITRNGMPHMMPTQGSNPKNRGIQFRMEVQFRNFSRQTG